MPWLPNGTFERINPDFQGPTVWQQDQSVPIKIIASRHDFHDEDLAQGIAAALNLDGFNQMRAALNMGGFSVVNLGNGPANDSAAAVGQTITAASFDDTTRILTLTRPTEPDLEVLIPGGAAGGGGTVTSIALGAGLAGPQNPITSVGSIALATIITPRTVSGPLASLTIDQFGRVTQAVAGTFPAPQNLAVGLSAQGALISITNGIGAAIPPATQNAVGVMSAADKAKLDGISAFRSGSWTPQAFDFSDKNTNTGSFVRVGNFVFVTGRYEWISKSAGTNTLEIRNLPFSVSNDSTFFTGTFLPIKGFSAPEPGAGGQSFSSLRFMPSTSRARFTVYSPVNSVTFPDTLLDYQSVSLENAGGVIFSGGYITEDP